MTEATAPQDDGGQWLRIAFMGHVEYAGYVTEVTRCGQPAYRVELPDYLWGEDKTAWVEHSASSWYSSRPLNDRALRMGWEADRRRKAEIAQWEARRKAQLALGAPDDSCCCDASATAHRHETDEDGVCRHCGCENRPAEPDGACDDEDPF